MPDPNNNTNNTNNTPTQSSNFKQNLKSIFKFTCYTFYTSFFYLWRSIVILLAKITPGQYLDEIITGLEIRHIPKHGSFIPISNILRIDGVPDVNLLKERIVTHVLDFKNPVTRDQTYRRFKQHPIVWLGYGFFKWDQDFCLEDHVGIEHPNPDEDLESFIARRFAIPFKPGHSPWEVRIIPNFPSPNESILFFRLHHILADGYSLIQLLERTNIFTDKNGESITNSLYKGNNGKIVKTNDVETNNVPTTTTTTTTALTTGSEAETKKHFLKTISESLNEKWLLISMFGKAFKSRPPKNLVNLPNPDKIEYAISFSKNTYFLHDFKKLKNDTGITLTAAVTSSLCPVMERFVSKYHPSKPPTEELTCLILQETTRSGGALQNKWAIIKPNLKLQQCDASNLQALFEKMTRNSGNNSGLIKFMLRTASYLPVTLATKLIGNIPQRQTPLVISNMPGPIESLYLQNFEVKEIIPCVVTLKIYWLYLIVISYNGKIKIGFTGSKHVVLSREILDSLVQDFEEELKKVLYQGDASYLV